MSHRISRQQRAFLLLLLFLGITLESHPQREAKVSDGDSVQAHNSYIPHLNFDVASIREAAAPDMRYMENPPDNSVFIARGMTLDSIILAAYNIKIPGLLRGVPAWAGSTHYDITAKSDTKADSILSRLIKREALIEKRHMLQLLLAERFGLRIHPEKKLGTTFELVRTARTASKMIPVKDFTSTISTCESHFVRAKGFQVQSKGCPFAFLVGRIELDLETDVVDHTGMSGAYAYTLEYKPARASPPPDEDWYPEMDRAIHEQLGLTLRKTHGEVTSWVIDHLERPTPN